MNFDLKKIELDVLIKFDKICRENELKYSLAYGTLIGAVRHNGFIPWDDDIDVVMPIDDYKKFIALNFEDENYKVLSSKNSNNYFYPFAKMCYKKIGLFESYRPETNLGPYVDIFPLDMVPDDIIKQKKLLNKNKNRMNNIFHIMCTSKSKYKDPKARRLKKTICFLLNILISNKKRKKIILKFERKCEKYNGNLLGNIRFSTMGINALLAKDCFDDLIELEFENHKFLSIKNYDTWLRSIYGDYTKLPPIEEQIPHHNFILETKENV